MKNNEIPILKIGLYLSLFVVFAISGCNNESVQVNDMVRIAQFNIKEMSTTKLTDVGTEGKGKDEQLRAATEIIAEIRPDILVLNEIDHDIEAFSKGKDLTLNARRFINNYLNQGKNPITYPYIYAAPCNTGILSSKDLDNNGKVATKVDRNTRDHGGDCYGYGAYPGQYAMAVLSRYPIQSEKVQTFQKFLWKDLPNNLIPTEWYSPDEIEIFRLSSKSHWDVPVQIGDKVIHLLVSHPTPPVFDGKEDRNGRRNYDELRMWVHYINNDSVLVDDSGIKGGLGEDKSFIIVGDLNAGPNGDKLDTGERSIDQLLQHEKIKDCGHLLVSEGALEGRQPGPPEYIERRTTGWRDRGLRIDHLLPSKDLKPLRGGVYWPAEKVDAEGAKRAELASDHRMIWLDFEI